MESRTFAQVGCALVFGLVACSGGSDDAAPTDSAGADVVDDSAAETLATDTSSEASEGGADGADSADAVIASGIPFVYVGVGDGNISIFQMDPATAALTPKGSVVAGAIPSFLAVAPDRKHLYAVNEVSSNIAAFSIDGATGNLTFLNRVSSSGSGPAWVSVDGSGKFVLVANYGGGNVAVLGTKADGSLSAPTATLATGANAHAFVVDAANKFAFVPCLGTDSVSQLLFDATTGKLTPNAVPKITTAAGAGPRHIELHPSGKFAYVINELDSTMSAYAYDSTKGTLSALQTISTLPPGDTTKNSGAEVHVSASGNFLYGSNRGHDSIVQFKIDTATGKLTLVGHTPSGGKTPRDFTLDPSGEFLLAANQESNNVVAFKIDKAAGTLTKLATTSVASQAFFVGVVMLPGK